MSRDIVDTCLKCHLTIRLMNLISDQSRDLYRSHDSSLPIFPILFPVVPSRDIEFL